MSKETFSRLVNQLSAEAEGIQLAEQRALRRRRILRAVGRGFCWLCLAGLLASGYVYRDDLGQAVAQFAGSQTPPPANAPNPLQELTKQVEKHAIAVEAAGR